MFPAPALGSGPPHAPTCLESRTSGFLPLRHASRTTFCPKPNAPSVAPSWTPRVDRRRCPQEVIAGVNHRHPVRRFGALYARHPRHVSAPLPLEVDLRVAPERGRRSDMRSEMGAQRSDSHEAWRQRRRCHALEPMVPDRRGGPRNRLPHYMWQVSLRRLQVCAGRRAHLRGGLARCLSGPSQHREG